MRYATTLRRLVTNVRTHMARLTAGSRRLIHAANSRADTRGGKLLLWALGTALKIFVQHMVG